jgi:hypothetical protein
MRTWIAETWSRNPRNALGGEDHAGRAHSLPQDRAAKLRERAPKLELRYRDRGTGPDHGEAEPDGIEAAADPFLQVCQVGNVTEPIRRKTRKRLEIEQRHPGRCGQIGGDSLTACTSLCRDRPDPHPAGSLLRSDEAVSAGLVSRDSCRERRRR